MAGAFNEQAFEQKLCGLKDTQESINAMSTWCLKNKEHHKKIVTCWLHCLKRVKIDQRLSLFYLANDVIQYSKRKHLDFIDSWGTALQKATTLVRDDKVRNRIMRIFKIWEERGVYDESFITDLCGLLTTNVKKKEPDITDPAEFQPSSLVKRVRECCLLEQNTDNRYRRVQDFKLPLTDAESMRLSLKDRRHGSDVAAEVDSGVRKMEAYVKALETEISSREKLIDALRQAMIFYEGQRGEAKIVANAYKNFGGRLRSRQKMLEEQVPNLMSPLPSPDVNAPSPSPDHDLEASHMAQPPPPAFNGGEIDFSFTSSFIGSQFINLHKDVLTNEPPQVQPEEGVQSIQVIGGGQAFNVAEFLKSLMPSKDTSLPPPPMPPPPVFGDWTGVPWEEPPPETPQSPPMYEKQTTHVQPIEYDDSLPVPPVPDVDQRSLMAMHGDSSVPTHKLASSDTDHRLPPVSMNGPPPPLGVDMDHRHMEYPPALVINPTEHHNLMMEPPPPLHIEQQRPLHLEPPPPLHMEAPRMLMEGPPLHRTDAPPPLRIDAPPPMRMDAPPPHMMEPQSSSSDLDHRMMRMDPPPSLMMDPQSNSSELDHRMLRMDAPPPLMMEPPSSASDLDHRMMRMDAPPPLMMEPSSNPNDMDHHMMRMEPPPNPEHLLSLDRGAILTGPPEGERDRRNVARNLISLTPRMCSDNVESVDMDVSEEDEEESQARGFGDGGEGRFHGGAGHRRGGPARFPRFPTPDTAPNTPLVEQCVGAKLIPAADTPNGMPRPRFSGEFQNRGPDFAPHPRGGDFSPRPRWRSPRPSMPYRTQSPFRANFRPRGRW